jgi:hypothetical protein
LLPVKELLERTGLSDLEVVAGDEPHVRTPRHRTTKSVVDATYAALLDERGDDRDVGGSIEERYDVAREGIRRPTGGERVLRRRRREVIAFARDDVAHASAWIQNVAAVSRDHVDVEVHHGLPRRLARVEADVVAIRPGLRVVALCLHVFHERHHGCAFVRGGGEPVGNHAPRDDERVPGRDRERVADREGEIVGRDPGRRQDCEEE